MKILHISNLGNGGRERRMIQLTRGLDASGLYEQAIICFENSIGYKEILDTQAKIFHVTAREKRLMRREIFQIIRQFNPDIVHVWETHPNRIFPALLMKFRCHYKLIAGFVASSTKVPFFSKENIAHQLFFGFSNAVISNSKCGAVANHAPKSKTHIIYNGFDYNRINYQLNIEEKRKELSLGDANIVMQFARFSEAKDWKAFVDVAGIAQRQRDNIVFLAVGEGETLETIKEYVISLKLSNIRFLGRRTDIEELLRITNVTVLLTNSKKHKEGLSNTILESMAAAVPVIATNAGGTPEIIESGVNGFMVNENNDSEEVYSYIKTLMSDDMLYGEISSAAESTVKEKFLLEKMTKQYEELYSDLLHKRR